MKQSYFLVKKTFRIINPGNFSNSGSEGARNIKARFENLAKSGEEEAKKKAEEERKRRQAREEREKEEQRRQQEVRGQKVYIVYLKNGKS